MSKQYHLFISHSWNYADHYNKLVNLLDQASCFLYNNHSIPANDPVHSGSAKELSSAIKNKMESCGIVWNRASLSWGLRIEERMDRQGDQNCTKFICSPQAYIGNKTI